MHPIARILAVAYVALAVFAAGVYVVLVGNDVAVAEVDEKIAGSVSVTAVEIHWDGNPSNQAVVVVNLTVRNPGRVAIEVIGVNYVLHIDNPNDPRNPFAADKLATTRIARVSVSGLALTVPVGATTVVQTNVTVPPTPEGIGRLNQTDANGRFHPIVLGPWIVYDFPTFDFPLGRPAFLSTYYDAQGVARIG